MSVVHDREPAGSYDEVVGGQSWLSLYRAMRAAREIERKEQELVRRGLAFFHVSGAGHEATAALAAHLLPADWLHCHYRDKALLIARGVPIREFFLSLLCRAGSHSAGRQMSAHLSRPELNVLSIVGPVGNQALQAVGVAAELKHRSQPGVVLCSAGDGTTQQGEFLEAIAEAVRDRLPVLFLIQDNRWAISTRTSGRTLYSCPEGPATEFYGLPIRQIDGRDAVTAQAELGAIVDEMRATSRAALVWFQVERLADHSNADDQMLYRNEDEIAVANATADPVTNMRQRLLDSGFEPAFLESLEGEIADEVAAEAETAIAAGEPEPTFEAKRPLNGAPCSGQRAASPAAGRDLSRHPAVTMAEALRATLRRLLETDDRIVLVGEDIEDPKGDVFGITRGLSTDFPGRVRNSALSEATIVGASIGRALAGARPIAFLQFADFLPLAYNQIASELGSLYWRTAGAWQAPVVVLITCGGYKPGLGPFHSQTLESIAAHVPGVDVVMPSTAADAAGLLAAAHAAGRPTLFFYPKSCLNLAEQALPAGIAPPVVPLGACRTVRSGRDLTFVSWGYPLLLCEKAAAALAECGIDAEVLDLRSLSPWDEATVCASVEKTGRLVVVHEDNHTCGFGAEVVATVAERVARHVQCKRVTRPDTWVPCHFPSQLEVLPSFRRVLTAAAELLGLELTWEAEPEELVGTTTVDALGSGPADESVLVTDVLVQPGSTVAEGDVIAIAEAAKSIVEISANASGVVDEVFFSAGDSVPVGQPLARIRLHSTGKHKKAVTQEQCGRPVLRRAQVVPPSGAGAQAPPSGGHVRGGLEPAEAGTTSAAGYRDIAVSARQRLLNHRLEQSLRTIPQGDLSLVVAHDKIAKAAARLREQNIGLAIGEFDLLAYCAARAAGAAPRMRSTFLGEGTLREHDCVNLGIAVHLEGDDLATAVVRGADRLSFPEFLRALEAQIASARSGADQAAHDVQLLLTHLGGLPVAAARPVLIAPAAAILFIGAPAAAANGAAVTLTLGFDHRILNGVAAAGFLSSIVQELEQLGRPVHDGNGARSIGTIPFAALGTALETASGSARRGLLEEHVCTEIAGLLKIDRARIQPDAPLRNQGLESMHATELARALERSLKISVPPTLAWNRPSVRDITQFLLEQLHLADGNDAAAIDSRESRGSGRALLNEIEQLGDDEVRHLLALLPGESEPEASDRVTS